MFDWVMTVLDATKIRHHVPLKKKNGDDSALHVIKLGIAVYSVMENGAMKPISKEELLESWFVQQPELLVDSRSQGQEKGVPANL